MFQFRDIAFRYEEQGSRTLRKAGFPVGRQVQPEQVWAGDDPELPPG